MRTYFIFAGGEDLSRQTWISLEEIRAYQSRHIVWIRLLQQSETKDLEYSEIRQLEIHYYAILEIQKSSESGLQQSETKDLE